MKRMIIIGAGAAGMMTAIHASENYDVTIIEKNDRPGKKLYITGKGRCNVTNASDEETFLKNVVTNPKFLYSAIYSYNQSRVISDFESWGVRLKIERGNRVFPLSDHSSDVIKALSNKLNKCGVKILYNREVKDLIVDEGDEYIGEENEPIQTVVGVEYVQNGRSKIEKLYADVVVITTGGYSYQATGSTGKGYEMLRKRGVTISPVRCALVPIETRESFVKELMGLSLKNVSLKVIASKDSYKTLKKSKILYEELGEMLFTHFGVSGPLCLSASSYISAFFDRESKKCMDKYPEESGYMSNDDIPGIVLEIDLKPGLSDEELDRRIIRDFEEFHNRDFQNSLGKLLPRLLIPVVIEKSGISPGKKVNSITSEERRKLLNVLKHFKLSVKRLRQFDEAIITGGGVSVKEINPHNMELKKIRNLRVAGEVIDCDALTGGFNLQIAWSTAYMAAQ